MEERADRLRKARIAAGFEKAIDASERFGWNENTYRANENGRATFSFKKAKEYAKAYGVRAEWLYDASGPAHDGGPTPPQPRQQAAAGDPVSLDEIRAHLAQRTTSPTKPVGKVRRIERAVPVLGEVAAGLWKEAPLFRAEDVEEWLPIDVPGYERAQLGAMKVTGPSMNLLYPPGRYVVFAHPAEAGLRVGDIVVVERRRHDLAEVTLKEFILENGRMALMPRSSDPAYQEPIFFKDPEASQQEGWTIIGVVIADYSRRERPPAMFERDAL